MDRRQIFSLLDMTFSGAEIKEYIDSLELAEHLICKYVPGYIARDGNNELHIFKYKPHLNARGQYWFAVQDGSIPINKDLFPNVTWESQECYHTNDLLEMKEEEQEHE